MPFSNGMFGSACTRHTTPSRVPCMKSAPAGLTPGNSRKHRETCKPKAYKHFTHRPKKHAIAQVGTEDFAGEYRIQSTNMFEFESEYMYILHFYSTLWRFQFPLIASYRLNNPEKGILKSWKLDKTYIITFK